MQQFLWQYIIGPIVADAKGAETVVWNGVTASTGYNPFNTLFYILLASATLYLIYRLLERKEIDLTSRTALYSAPFILLGGTLRYLDDAQLVSYPFSIPLITPLVYFLIAAVFLPALYRLEDRDRAKFGTAVLTPVLIYALTSFQTVNIVYILGTLALSGISTAIYWKLFQGEYVEVYMVLLAFSQLFEGSASMFSSFYGYSPKQLLGGFFDSLLGFPGVFVMKLGVLALAVSVVTDLEDDLLRFLVLVALYSVGLGTGFRVFLRTAAGI